MGESGNTEEGPEAEAPPFIWRTLIGRTVFEYDSALHGENAGALLNDTYLEGLCQEQKKITRSMNLLFWASLVLAWALIAKTINWSSLEITVLGVSLPTGLISKQVLFFSLAMLFAQCMLKVISLIISTQILQRAAQFHFNGAWKVYLAKYDADTLWVDILQPRLIGYGSPTAHHLFNILALLVMVSISIVQLILVNVAAIKVFNELWNSATTSLEKTVALLSFIVIATTTLAFIIAVCVPLKFHLKESK